MSSSADLVIPPRTLVSGRKWVFYALGGRGHWSNTTKMTGYYNGEYIDVAERVEPGCLSSSEEARAVRALNFRDNRLRFQEQFSINKEEFIPGTPPAVPATLSKADRNDDPIGQTFVRYILTPESEHGLGELSVSFASM